MSALGIDAGGSGTRWRALDRDGTVFGEGSVAPFSGHLFDPARLAEARAALAALRARLDDAGVAARHVVAGVTGLSAGGDEAASCATLLAEALGLKPSNVTVCGDLVLAYHAAFSAGEGIVVYAGTGSAACHVEPGGRLLRVGGHGHILDDAGSAYWIGREAIRWLVRWLETSPDGAPTALAEALSGPIGALTWPAVRRHVYEAPRPRLAALAMPVAAAAEQGDDTALRILGEAGQALAALAVRMMERVGAKPIAVAGRVAALHPAIVERMAGALPAAAWPVAVVDAPPVDAAARLALEALGSSPMTAR